jgi:hypothetical protein
LSAALEGLELQQQRIEEQIRYVKSLLERKRPEAPPAGKKTGRKRRPRRELSEAARVRISTAQRKRWAAYRKAKKAAAKAAA